MKKKDDIIFLEHILECVQAIEDFSKDIEKEDLNTNRLKKSAIIREIEIIEEASKNISEKLKNKYPKIPWKKITGARNIIIHKYFNIDINVIWGIVTNEIPILKEEINKIKEVPKII